MAVALLLLACGLPAVHSFSARPLTFSPLAIGPLGSAKFAIARHETVARRDCRQVRMNARGNDHGTGGRMRRQLAAMLGSAVLAATPFDQHALAVAQVASQQVLSISTSAGPAVATQAGQGMMPKNNPGYLQTWRYSDFLDSVEENRVAQVRSSYKHVNALTVSAAATLSTRDPSRHRLCLSRACPSSLTGARSFRLDDCR